MAENKNKNPERKTMDELCASVPDVPRHEVRRIVVKATRRFDDFVLAD